MHLEDKHLEQIRKILTSTLPECEVWAYGSRVHGEHLKKFSDLDLVVKTAISFSDLLKTKESFSESNLPIKVDISRWEDISSDFRKIIEKNFEVVQTPSE